MCVAAVVVRSVRVAREVQRAHGCVASSCRAWCSSDLGDGWAEVLLSEQSQVSESLAEECEAVGEARPPRRVARISGVHWCCDESVLLTHHWSRASDDCVRAA